MTGTSGWYIRESPLTVRATDDAGLLPLHQFYDRIGLTAQLAAALHDPRDPERVEHTFPEMVQSRVFGILAGDADQNDHETLRTDPVFKLIANHAPTDADLASQPTLGVTSRNCGFTRASSHALSRAEEVK